MSVNLVQPIKRVTDDTSQYNRRYNFCLAHGFQPNRHLDGPIWHVGFER